MLHMAIEQGDAELFKWLLAHNKTVNGLQVDVDVDIGDTADLMKEDKKSLKIGCFIW